MTNNQLNELQSEGIISDLCVTWSDVAPCDKERAIEWLNRREEFQQTVNEIEKGKE